MRAFVKKSAEDDTVELAEVPVPRIDNVELLVRVHAIGVGIHDTSFVPADAAYPYPIGIEAAGVIEEIGKDVSGFQPGERVAFISSMQSKGGTWAEYAAVESSSLIVPIPSAMGFGEAAAAPVAGNTALRAIEALGVTPPGGSLFVAGGSGAVGTFAIQIARQRGWRVGASSSTRNHDYLRMLGAEAVVDYHDSDWTQQIQQWAPTGVDAAIAVQPNTSAQVMEAVQDGGHLISISGDRVEPERGVRVEVVPHLSDVRDDLVEMMDRISRGEAHVEIERTYPFEDALDALARVQTRHTRGKLVVVVE
ncbi:NADP-dependent oxidoreductase [Rhodococcus sp. PAMC28707]|uniref:NADP-dependent oxidoreductase n=1 Tax=unclassified Rhodococcus (in: high G+C Gram-positive bacteria) TaxID=192944 RepID=UPI00109DD0D8|nr:MULTISPECIES: NADP-dependent oxidoreductase [unclassified Rhodococcus (in: high G+C Gram-positive bacteria)]QCB50996.1 NADP-dependent oxidoreductase [Rhodococcus sp. PAMC28705]QCB57311.1 NADP-dependent oxidoreductase [Rhodococcus sp. PAMC28707]